MDISRVTSPPSITVYDFNGNHGRAARSSREQGGMSIPGARPDDVPPPLPPPKDINDFAAGGDPGWQWGNTPSRSGGFGKSGGSVSPGSSLRGHWDQRMGNDGRSERPEYTRHGSSNSTVRSRPDPDRRHDFSSRFIDEGYHSLSGSSLANQLHGERHLERANLENSSQAYDNKLLSKIGKPKTPPRTASLGSVEASPTSGMAFHQGGKYPQKLKSLSMSDGSMGTAPSEPQFKKEPSFRRFRDSPRSRAISPGLISSAASAKNYMDYRSPAFDGMSPLSAGELDQPARFSSSNNAGNSRPSRGPPHHHRQRRESLSGSGSVFSNFDESAAGSFNSTSEHASRLNRSGHDQSILFDPDSAADFPMEETGALRQLHLEDRPPPSLDFPYYYSSSADARSGMSLKRRASSPPPEAAHDDKALHSAGGSSSELYQRSTAHLAASRGSPINRFAPIQGSISSASSGGLRNGSYASSGGLSVGGSSISSISTHERLSPGGLSPASDQLNTRDLQHTNSLPMTSSPRDSLSRPHQRTPSDTKSSAAIARKMSSENSGPRKLHNAPGLQAHAHICECCPKKPKKFDTLEELKNHESEKQYSCNFCNNRFKNKNEAERHQNSLHLRRHSWSCATLAGSYEAAFHPSTAIAPNNPSPAMDSLPAMDICGYCGLHFPNDPHPDWDDRVNHLQNVHKFGECNQSKKFFRADHFRQHLKHSHAGTSGKWTNMLENACMKDEPNPPGPETMQASPQVASAPVANMGMGPRMSMPGASGMREDRIEEEY